MLLSLLVTSFSFFLLRPDCSLLGLLGPPHWSVPLRRQGPASGLQLTRFLGRKCFYSEECQHIVHLQQLADGSGSLLFPGNTLGLTALCVFHDLSLIPTVTFGIVINRWRAHRARGSGLGWVTQQSQNSELPKTNLALSSVPHTRKLQRLASFCTLGKKVSG